MNHIAIIGGGPAGLIAAETLRDHAVTVYDRMPSVGRKFLMAGRGGLNLTHSEDFETFVTHYRESVPRAILEAFPPAALIAWANGLGAETFTGSSGRIFPKAMKASPLLRAWLVRLREQGVAFRLRHDWLGWNEYGALRFRTPDGEVTAAPDETILALGGASWPKLGGTGAWTSLLNDMAPLRPANCGFTLNWSERIHTSFAGAPLKNAQFRFGGHTVRGEAVLTAYGIEGGAIYALSAQLRDAIAKDGSATLTIDLRPDLTEAQLCAKLARPRGKASLSNFLRKTLNLSSLETALLHEAHGVHLTGDLAAKIKALPLALTAAQPIARAISTAGGVRFASLDDHLMLKERPGTFIAGEMLDWEAPTGGYLLQASFATGVVAARGAMRWAKE